MCSGNRAIFIQCAERNTNANLLIHKGGLVPLQPADRGHLRKGYSIAQQGLAHQSRCHGGDVPAARAKATKYRLLCHIRIQMIGLRIKASGEGYNRIFIQGNSVATQCAFGGGRSRQNDVLLYRKPCILTRSHLRNSTDFSAPAPAYGVRC